MSTDKRACFWELVDDLPWEAMEDYLVADLINSLPADTVVEFVRKYRHKRGMVPLEDKKAKESPEEVKIDPENFRAFYVLSP